MKRLPLALCLLSLSCCSKSPSVADFLGTWKDKTDHQVTIATAANHTYFLSVRGIKADIIHQSSIVPARYDSASNTFNFRLKNETYQVQYFAEKNMLVIPNVGAFEKKR